MYIYIIHYIENKVKDLTKVLKYAILYAVQ